MTKKGLALSLVEPIVAWYLTLTERSQFTRTLVYGVTAFLVIFAIDLLCHISGRNWFWERLMGNAALRRQQEVRYLNHHIRNALSPIQMAAQKLDADDLHATAVRHASNRICKVLEQMSRNEEVSIDEEVPERRR